MNTEQRLRHAAAEMERVTGSVTPPPIAEVRRSARFRAIGVSVAAAVGAAVLVGGAVLLLRPPGEVTLSPAGPNGITEPVVEVDGIPVVIPELDPPPEFDLGSDAREVDWQLPGDNLVDDLGRDLSDGWLDEVTEVVFVGASGEYRAYELVGSHRNRGAGDAPSGSGSCLVEVGPGGNLGANCGGGDSRGAIGAGTKIVDGVATFWVSGRAPAGSSVVVLEIDGSRYWRPTRDGYAILAVEGSIEAQVRYTFYDVDGNVLAGSAIGSGEITTTAPAVEADGSCSGGLHYPETYPRADLPEPVSQTLAKITLFGSRCWFEDLADVGGDNFTASFGGGDPIDQWTYEEEQGYEPMAALMQILDMPHGTIETENGILFVWPSAYAHQGDWSTVPAADKEALRPFYDNDDFAGFDEFGGYIGYRVGIWENGDWSFFVAGD